MLELEWQHLHSLIHTLSLSLSNSKSVTLYQTTCTCYIPGLYAEKKVLSSFADAKLFDTRPSIYTQGHARAVHIRYVCF